MVAGTGASAVPNTVDLTDFARIARDDRLGAIDGSRLASPHGWKTRSGVTTTAAASGNAALEIGWTGA